LWNGDENSNKLAKKPGERIMMIIITRNGTYELVAFHRKCNT